VQRFVERRLEGYVSPILADLSKTPELPGEIGTWGTP
jgi:hypothetical protein